MSAHVKLIRLLKEALATARLAQRQFDAVMEDEPTRDDPPVRRRRRREPPPPPPRDDPPPPRGDLTVLEGEQWVHMADGKSKGGDHTTLPRKDISFNGIHFKGAKRSCIFSSAQGYVGNPEAPAGTPELEDYLYDLVVANSIFDTREPNTFEHFVDGNDGTLWGSRESGLRNATVVGCTAKDFFGNSYDHDEQDPLVTQQEGHVLYWVIVPRLGSVYRIEDCHFENCGGHGLQVMTEWTGAASGSLPSPRHGEHGQIVLRRSKFINTDRCPHRGSYTISLFDSNCSLLVEDCYLEANHIYPEWGWDGTPEGAYNARGLVMMKGESGNATFRRTTFAQGNKPKKSAITIRGPEVVTFEDCHIEQGVVKINSLFYYDNQKVETRKVLFSGCTGDAVLQVGGKVVGRIDEDRVWDLEAMGLLEFPELTW